jgi:hypothetical protein
MQVALHCRPGFVEHAFVYIIQYYMKIVLGGRLGNSAAHSACTANANCFYHGNQLAMGN